MEKEIDIERAWKDEEYRNSLTPEQLKDLPPNPAGEVELTEDDLESINGGILANDNIVLAGSKGRTKKVCNRVFYPDLLA